MNTQVSVLLCTAPDAETAGKLGNALVEERLAACVNIVPGLRSIYRWEGKVQDGSEVLMIIKARSSAVTKIQSWIERNHPYSTPEVLALPVEQGTEKYLSWVLSETAG